MNNQYTETMMLLRLFYETDNPCRTNTLYSTMGIFCNHNINEIKAKSVKKEMEFFCRYARLARGVGVQDNGNLCIWYV